MPEKIIMALKLSNTVHGKSTENREKREVPAVIQDLDVGHDHEVYRKSSQFCGHQEVCENYTSQFRYTQPGKLLHISAQCHSHSWLLSIKKCAMLICARIEAHHVS